MWNAFIGFFLNICAKLTCSLTLTLKLHFNHHTNSRSSNPRLKNVAEVFLQDYCKPVQVMEAEQAQKQWAQQVQTQAEDSLKQIQAKENTVQADKG